DLVLPPNPALTMLANADVLGRSSVRQQCGVAQRVVQHHIRLTEQLRPAEREQPRITGAGPEQTHTRSHISGSIARSDDCNRTVRRNVCTSVADLSSDR